MAYVMMFKSTRLLVAVVAFTILNIVEPAATEVTLAVEGKMRDVESLAFCCIASASDVIQTNVSDRN